MAGTEESTTATGTTTERTASPDDETELGLAPNLLAVLGYVFNVVGAVLLLVVEDNEYVRHHAAQSLLFTGAVVVVRFVAGIVVTVLGFVPVVGTPLAVLVNLVVWAGVVGGFLFLMYKAYSGERYALPVLGEYIDDVEGLI